MSRNNRDPEVYKVEYIIKTEIEASNIKEAVQKAEEEIIVNDTTVSALERVYQ